MPSSSPSAPKTSRSPHDAKRVSRPHDAERVSRPHDADRVSQPNAERVSLSQKVSALTDAHAIPPAVLWSEGMLLSPQHFQQAELHASGLRSYMALAASPYCWGVQKLRIDEAALLANSFAITELEAIMPDGLLVLHEDKAEPGAPKLQVDLTPSLSAAGSARIAIHLTVAAPSATSLLNGQQQRFRQMPGVAVADENTGADPVAVQRLVPRLTLHVTDGPLCPPPPVFVSLPLAVLECDGQRFKPAHYDPPRVRVDRDTPLYQLADRLSIDLRRKAMDWHAGVRDAPSNSGEAVGDLVAILRALVRGLPRLEALLQSTRAHPFAVYLALCDITGDLAVVSGQLTLPRLEPYAHADALAAYRVIETQLRAALANLVTPHKIAVFDHQSPGRFELRLLAEYPSRGLVIGARLAPGMDPVDVKSWFSAAVIATADRSENVRINSAIGASRVAITSADELDLVPPPNMLLFRVHIDPAFITAGEVLRIGQGAGDTQTEPLELMHIFPATTAPVPR